MNENEDGGFEVEASPTFFSSGGGGGLVEEDDDIDIEQLPQQYDESTMNDESTIAAASSYISRGYSYVASNTKWFVIAMASFAVFLGIGLGSGYGIGNISMVSDGGAKSGKSKSDKLSGVSCVEYCTYTDFVHMIWTNRHFIAMTTNQLILPSNIRQMQGRRRCLPRAHQLVLRHRRPRAHQLDHQLSRALHYHSLKSNIFIAMVPVVIGMPILIAGKEMRTSFAS